MQTGIVPLQFANGNVWGSLWSIGGGFIGVVLVTLLLGVVMRSVTMRVYRPI